MRAATTTLRVRGETARRGHVAIHVTLLLLLLSTVPAVAQVELPELNQADPISISAQAGNQWQVGIYDVWVLQGNCTIQQGQAIARCREAVLWIERPDVSLRQPNKVIAYLEGDVDVLSKPGAAQLKDQTWLGRFFSTANVQVHATTVAGKPDTLPAVYWRGMERRTPEAAGDGWRGRVQPAQFTTPAPQPVQPGTPPQPAASATPAFPESRPGVAPTMVPVPAQSREGPAVTVGGGRRIRVFPRSNAPVQAQWFPDPASNRWIAVIDSGVNAIVDGLPGVGTLDISTDRLVIWTMGDSKQTPPDLQGGAAQDERVPLEFYMEGNIVFRLGERVIYADRMFYDVPNNVGRVLNAEMLTPVKNYQGLLRLHADVLQQTAKDRFYAQNTFLTSSRIGEPSYRLQAGDVYFEDIQQPAADPLTGQPLVDAETGQPVVDHRKQVTASNNFLFMGPVPVFYWPIMSADLNESTYYIRSARVGYDQVFGTQVLTRWNGYELLGVRNKPEGTDFELTLDYLSDRGFGYGGAFRYDRAMAFDVPRPSKGFLDYWGIQDHGTDSLGEYRMNLEPEKSYRFRLYGQHRQQLPYDLQLSAELGWISDRNFLEEYYKSEWDELKDKTTGVELKHMVENRSLSITADYNLNPFFTQTDWLPRLDHFWLGQPLMNDTFTWFEHSSAGYARFNRLNAPTNVNDQPFSYLPWESTPTAGSSFTRAGERFATRQELDWPFQLGAVKVVPYVMGELAHWGEDLDGSPLDRAWGQVGVRASLPMASVDPTVSDDLFNVHGIAHKVVFDAEFSAADANRDFTNLPLYDALDDDSVEAFRRHLATTTFGWPSTIPPTTAYIPTRFEERYYALRTGLQSWVTSPSTEVADDLMAVRLGASQRWQTKRGPVNNRRIIDWITLDTHISLYPDAQRDNSGNTAGLFDYDFSWHVGDRLTLVSDAMFDFFDQGQKIISVGGFLNRPPRGSLYLGFRIIEGPTRLDSQVLSLSYSYWMSPKWVSSFGTSIDFGGQGNIGESLTIMRIGESFLVSAGFSVDPIRQSWGANFMIQPRFLSKTPLSNVNGAQIQPAGAYGLE